MPRFPVAGSLGEVSRKRTAPWPHFVHRSSRTLYNVQEIFLRKNNQLYVFRHRPFLPVHARTLMPIERDRMTATPPFADRLRNIAVTGPLVRLKFGGQCADIRRQKARTGGRDDASDADGRFGRLDRDVGGIAQRVRCGWCAQGAGAALCRELGGTRTRQSLTLDSGSPRLRYVSRNPLSALSSLIHDPHHS